MHGLGIDTDGPGYRKIILAPAINSSLGKLSGSYESINGVISSDWEVQGKKLTLKQLLKLGLEGLKADLA